MTTLSQAGGHTGNRKSIRSADLPACVNRVLVRLRFADPFRGNKGFSKAIHIQLKLLCQFLRRREACAPYQGLPSSVKKRRHVFICIILQELWLNKMHIYLYYSVTYRMAIRKKRRQSCAVVSLKRWRLPTLPLSQYHRRDEV